MASAKQEAANKRAQALGFKNAYDRRIKTALAKGKTRSEARGNHPKETKIRKKQPTPLERVREAVKNAKPKQITIIGNQHEGKGKIRKNRKITIELNQHDSEIWHGLKAAGKNHAALTFALANVYVAPALTAGEYFDEDIPYDDYPDIDDDYYDVEDDDYSFVEA